MAKNFVQDGGVVTVVAAANVLSGAPVLHGATLFGFAMHDALLGEDLQLATEGVFTIKADNNLVISVGDRLFWVPASSQVDKTAAGQVNVGVAVADKVQAGTSVAIRLGAVTPAGT